MKIVVLKYKAGNIRSVEYALNRMGIKPLVSDSAADIRSADKLIIPGVGEASTALSALRSRGLDKLIKNLSIPVLGICLGMQLLCTSIEEGPCQGLEIFPQSVLRFTRGKVPHMGWNQVEGLSGELFSGIDPGTYFYFVHSYFAEPSKETIAVCDYNGRFSAALNQKNFYGVQFHPEKSGELGQRVLQNFCSFIPEGEKNE